MSSLDRHSAAPNIPDDEPPRDTNVAKLLTQPMIAIGVIVVVLAFQPFVTVPTGMRAVVTQLGAITGIEPEGLVLLPHLQH